MLEMLLLDCVKICTSVKEAPQSPFIEFFFFFGATQSDMSRVKKDLIDEVINKAQSGWIVGQLMIILFF